MLQGCHIRRRPRNPQFRCCSRRQRKTPHPHTLHNRHQARHTSRCLPPHLRGSCTHSHLCNLHKAKSPPKFQRRPAGSLPTSTRKCRGCKHPRPKGQIPHQRLQEGLTRIRNQSSGCPGKCSRWRSPRLCRCSQTARPLRKTRRPCRILQGCWGQNLGPDQSPDQTSLPHPRTCARQGSRSASSSSAPPLLHPQERPRSHCSLGSCSSCPPLGTRCRRNVPTHPTKR